MHNPILNQKMRLVDLGVVTCIDSVIRHCETLLNENSSEAEQTRAKAQIRLNAGIYRNTLDELVLALDEPSFTKSSMKQTACCESLPSELPEIIEQCEKIVLAVETEKALVNVYENYTSLLRTCDKDYLLNEINALSHVHHVYLQHISDEVNRLQSMLQGGSNANP
ncbi:hypothetical protein [Glaesserella parasuis]|uniref:hypothetical protein n=1 Tax=Glaesserella parasuis TaxID=738 RepID=UPI0009941451|nr:hypothetical protein [Glaesserella parasuis]MCT8526262.1 hypothetical protein [Glaesserella parasuis]MCT8528432.1 hypothetical protein [Glaesserella parasuis]MCT8530899.1 hypothetical protein [Glaesserella parasuis]MCT8533087.1 hypothetical protein [Glaesserella parasuis]MCT8537179.1 hypothetical protein [Glaesserella parasuis]